MRTAPWLLVALLLALGPLGCSRASGESPHPAAAPSTSGAPAEYYTLSVSPAPSWRSGVEGSVDVRVEPRGGFHISQDFPTELRVNPVDGVTLARPVLAPAQAAEFTEQRAHFRLAMTPTASGHRHMTGVFRFALCNPSSCLPERRTIEWDVVAQ